MKYFSSPDEIRDFMERYALQPVIYRHMGNPVDVSEGVELCIYSIRGRVEIVAIPVPPVILAKLKELPLPESGRRATIAEALLSELPDETADRLLKEL